MIFGLKEIKYPKTMVEYKESCLSKLQLAFKISGLSTYMEGCTRKLSLSTDILEFSVERRKVQSDECFSLEHPFSYPFSYPLREVPQYENKIKLEILVDFQYFIWNEITDWYRSMYTQALDQLGINYHIKPIEWLGDNTNGSKNFSTSIVIDFSKEITDEEMEKITTEYKEINNER